MPDDKDKNMILVGERNIRVIVEGRELLPVSSMSHLCSILIEHQRKKFILMGDAANGIVGYLAAQRVCEIARVIAPKLVIDWEVD